MKKDTTVTGLLMYLSLWLSPKKIWQDGVRLVENQEKKRKEEKKTYVEGPQ
jgi:hypothetical protein